MVIIVISVMGGFLDMMRGAVQTLEGQIIIKSDMNGFGEYEKLLERLHRLPQVKAATPVITTYGLLGLPSVGSQTLHTVEVWGIEPASFDQVVNYRKTLFWTKQTLVDSLQRTIHASGEIGAHTRKTFEDLKQSYLETDLVDYGMRLQPPASWGRTARHGPRYSCESCERAGCRRQLRHTEQQDVGQSGDADGAAGDQPGHAIGTGESKDGGGQ